MNSAKNFIVSLEKPYRGQMSFVEFTLYPKVMMTNDRNKAERYTFERAQEIVKGLNNGRQRQRVVVVVA